MVSSFRLACFAAFIANFRDAVPVSNKLVRQHTESSLQMPTEANRSGEARSSKISRSQKIEHGIDAAGAILKSLGSSTHKVSEDANPRLEDLPDLPHDHINIAENRAGVEALEEDALRSDEGHPIASLLACEAGPAAESTEEMSVEQYDGVVQNIHESLGSLSASCNRNSCERGEFAACILRFAGHDFMDYKNGTGGSDGCLNFAETDNMGLASCLTSGVGNPPQLLSSSYAKVCTNISFADFLVIAAEAVMTYTRGKAMDAMSGLEQIDFKTQYRYGRNTSFLCTETTTADGMPKESVPLPNPEGSCDEVKRVFIDNMGLSWEETAALSGAHTLGQAKLENSGYKGYWSGPSDRELFNNEYFVALAMRGWLPKKGVGGAADKNIWVRGDHASSDYSSFDHVPQMMLNTDVCLLWTNSFNKTIKAGDQLGCCAWLNKANDPLGAGQNDTACARAKENEDDSEGTEAESRGWCCGGDKHHLDCNKDSPSGKAAQHVMRFAKNDKDWITAFKRAWAKATENGRDDLIWLIAPEHKHPPPEEKSYLMMILLVSVPIVLIVVGAGVYQVMNKEKQPGGMSRRPQQQYSSDSDYPAGFYG